MNARRGLDVAVEAPLLLPGTELSVGVLGDVDDPGATLGQGFRTEASASQRLGAIRLAEDVRILQQIPEGFAPICGVEIDVGATLAVSRIGLRGLYVGDIRRPNVQRVCAERREGA